MQRALYLKSLDSQEGLVLALLDEMEEQLNRQVSGTPLLSPPSLCMQTMIAICFCRLSLHLQLRVMLIISLIILRSYSMCYCLHSSSCPVVHQALLAFFVLLRDHHQLTDIGSLDARVEQVLEEHFGCAVDFAVEVALCKLHRDDIISVQQVRHSAYLPFPPSHLNLKRGCHAYLQFFHSKSPNP
jgi:hypothetical protein